MTPKAGEASNTPQKVLVIPHWRERYEVSDKNRAWTAGDELRSGPLEYTRLRARGDEWPGDYRDMVARAGENDVAAVNGVYTELLGLSAKQKADRRGMVLDTRGMPASIAWLSKSTGCSQSDIEKAIQILTDERVAWLEWVDFEDPQLQSGGVAGDSGKSREIPEDSGILPSETESYSDPYSESDQNRDAAGAASPPSDCKPSEPDEEKYTKFMGHWNECAARCGWTRMRKWTAKRRKAFSGIMLTPGWHKEAVRALKMAESSPFLCGKNDRKTGMRVDWFLKPDSVTKILEGQYGGNGSQHVKAAKVEYTEETLHLPEGHYVVYELYRPEDAAPYVRGGMLRYPDKDEAFEIDLETRLSQEEAEARFTESFNEMPHRQATRSVHQRQPNPKHKEDRPVQVGAVIDTMSTRNLQ